MEKRLNAEKVKFEKREETIKNEGTGTKNIIKSENVKTIGGNYKANVYGFKADMLISDEYELMPEYF
jgi:hypothetical protein